MPAGKAATSKQTKQPAAKAATSNQTKQPAAKAATSRATKKPPSLAQLSATIKKDSRANNGYVTAAQAQGYLDKGTFSKDQLSQVASQVYKNPTQAKNRGALFTGDALDALGINKTYYQPEYEKGSGASWNMQQGPLLIKNAGYAWERAPVVAQPAVTDLVNGPQTLVNDPQPLVPSSGIEDVLTQFSTSLNTFESALNKEPPKPEFQSQPGIQSQPELQAKPEIQSSTGASLTGNATGFKSAKSSWRKSGQSMKGANSLTIKQIPSAKNIGLNIKG